MIFIQCFNDCVQPNSGTRAISKLFGSCGCGGSYGVAEIGLKWLSSKEGQPYLLVCTSSQGITKHNHTILFAIAKHV